MGQIESIFDRIELASRYERDRRVYSVSEPESNHMARASSHKIADFDFIKIFKFKDVLGFFKFSGDTKCFEPLNVP